MAELAEREFELSGLVFGAAGSSIPVEVFEPGGKPEIRTQDANLPAQDGLRMGRDFLGGATFTLEGLVNQRDPANGWASWRQLRDVWNAAATRGSPAAVLPLRMRMPGQATTRVYGRPRRISPSSMANVGDGVIPFVADFQAVDHLVYSDVEHMLTITGDAIEYTGTAGVTTPHAPPVTLAQATLPEDTATNAGNAGGWPIFVLHGPREKPGVSYVNENRSVSLAMTLGSGRSVTIDTRPWRRTVLRDDGASLAGMLRGSRLSELAFSPGDTQLAFEGRDSTLTSSVEVKWRDAFSSL